MTIEQRILALQKDKGALIDKVRELENEIARLTNENKILKQGKTNVFAELNQETAENNAMLIDKTLDLEAQIKKMKSDVLNLIKGRMNEDIDQNLIERMADKWGLKYD